MIESDWLRRIIIKHNIPHEKKPLENTCSTVTLSGLGLVIHVLDE